MISLSSSPYFSHCIDRAIRAPCVLFLLTSNLVPGQGLVSAFCEDDN
jgi:hypothetical protein